LVQSSADLTEDRSGDLPGNNTFTPQHLGFSNLTCQVTGDPAKELTIRISASHLMECVMNRYSATRRRCRGTAFVKLM
jgi:hypothetical protein